MKNFLVRLAASKDSKNIFDWRNDTLTRSMSHSNKIIDWKQHKKWFANSLDSKDCLLVICEYDYSNKIAVVRFDINESGALISINLNPSHRGKSLGKESLIQSIKFFSKKYPLIKKLFAEVNEENVASKKTFLGVGFEKFKAEDHVCYYLKYLI